LQTLYRTTILEFDRFLTDFGYELSNYKSDQLLPSSIIGSWWFFRARVDHLHMSNNASQIFFQCTLLIKANKQQHGINQNKNTGFFINCMDFVVVRTKINKK
jgi:hypothetical protein